ncbi:MAG: UDP-N-acetylglucosamine 2-epimerase (non-hydrolyzing) [bacterium]|nr:UDP-N-acetylglucosamine 2-epimerase (non-hydrolyzing) [bacterium]
MKKIFLVGGARPNFMKIAPLWKEFKKYKHLDVSIVHTGQHYDFEMSQAFFQDLKLPNPNFYLGIGPGTHAEQTANIMIKFEKLLYTETPDIVIIVGDVNSTIACALATIKFRCSVNSTNRPLIVHIESGLRSFDRTIPEEINRVLTDTISDLLFTPSLDANENLKEEGTLESKIYFTGNIMIDSLLAYKKLAKKSKILEKLGLKKYALLTLHRPNNVDDKKILIEIINTLKEISKTIPIVFPAHPRTKKRLTEFGLLPDAPITLSSNNPSAITNNFLIIDPVRYIDFLSLESNAKFILTDSGGIQEESTVLGIPCLTLRDNTERPITVTQGTNIIVGTKRESILKAVYKIMTIKTKKRKIPELWDGKTAQRIVKILNREL